MGTHSSASLSASVSPGSVTSCLSQWPGFWPKTNKCYCSGSKDTCYSRELCDLSVQLAVGNLEYSQIFYYTEELVKLLKEVEGKAVVETWSVVRESEISENVR